MLTRGAFSLRSGTPSNYHWQVPFKLLFFLALRWTNSSLSSPNNRLFSSAYHTSERRREAPGEREGGRITSAWQCHTVGTGLMSCVFGPLGLGVQAPLSYNKVDKNPRAQPSGNLRGRGAYAGAGRLCEGETKQLRYLATSMTWICGN